MPTSDLSYHLDAAARARLQPGVDANALESLLRYFPAESRVSHLDMFSIPWTMVDADGRAEDVTTLDRVSEPVMQQLLEEVWQPFWASVSDAELEGELSGPPGRELARRRRSEPRRD